MPVAVSSAMVRCIMSLIFVSGRRRGTMSIYPNPCHGQLHLSVNNGQGFDYRVYDLRGQTITAGHSQGQEIIIDLSKCPAGVYFVSVDQDAKRMVNKIMYEP